MITGTIDGVYYIDPEALPFEIKSIVGVDLGHIYPRFDFAALEHRLAEFDKRMRWEKPEKCHTDRYMSKAPELQSLFPYREHLTNPRS